MRRSWERDGADEASAAMIGRILRAAASRRDEASRWYVDALAAHPDWQRLREEQVSWLAGQGDFAAAIRSAREGLAARPADLLAMRRLSILLVEHGTSDVEIQEGVALVRATIDRDPSNAFAHAALGRGLLRLGDRAGAAASFRRAVEIAPESEAIRAMAAEASPAKGSGAPGMPR